jgi:CheY-like chemotaxis protein
MPQMDGYELIRALRDRHKGGPFPPGIAVTAFARTEDRRRALLAGYQSHVAKPVDPQDLLIEIASLCRRT